VSEVFFGAKVACNRFLNRLTFDFRSQNRNLGTIDNFTKFEGTNTRFSGWSYSHGMEL